MNKLKKIHFFFIKNLGETLFLGDSIYRHLNKLLFI